MILISDIDKQIIETLVQIRIEKGLKLTEVAQKCNLTVSCLSQYENMRRALNMTLFYAWCAALDKKPHQILQKCWEKDHPRSHTSKKKQAERLSKKPFAELTSEEIEFLKKYNS